MWYGHSKAEREVNRWEYLSTPSFKSRYVLAAHYLRHCKRIIEVGGYKNCVSEFLSEGCEVFAVDPYLDLPESISARRFTIPISKFDLSCVSGQSFGLACLGFDIGVESVDFFRISDLTQRADVVVLECADEHLPSVLGVEILMRESGKKVELTVGMNLTGNKLDIPADGYPPFFKRTLIVLR